MSPYKNITRSRTLAFAFAAIVLLAFSPIRSIAQASAAKEASANRIVLPTPTTIAEGTRVLLTVKQTLKSGAAKMGEPVLFEVAADVFSPDRQTLLIPKGARAFGEVDQSRAAGAFGRPGSIRVQCNYLELSDGTRVPLRPARASMSSSGRNQSGAAIGTGLLLGTAAGTVVAYASVAGSVMSSGRTVAGAPALLTFAGTALLVSALVPGGTATIREGKLLEAATAAEAPLPAGAQRTNRAPESSEKE